MHGEYSWSYVQHFKDVLTKLTFLVHESRHKNWFIQGLLPLTMISLSQQVIDSPRIVLEKVMKFEDMDNYPNTNVVGDSSYSRELAQVHNKLVEITKRIEDLNTKRSSTESMVYQLHDERTSCFIIPRDERWKNCVGIWSI